MENEDLCGMSIQNLDFNLVEATLLSIETKTLTPIIKEELKLKIQSKRLAAGKEELPKSVFKEPEKCKLSPEEEEKRDTRRERNRIAAAKCRNKRKYQAENLKTVLAEEQLKNFTLKRKLEILEKEKHEILKKLKLENSVIAQSTSTDPPQSTHHLSPEIHSPVLLPSTELNYTSPSPVTISQSPVPQMPSQFPPSPVSVPPSFSSVPESPVPQSLSPVPQSQVVQSLSSVPPSAVLLSPAPVVPSSSTVVRSTFSSNLNMHHEHQEFDINYMDLPSTSSGIYDHEPIPRRYSEDIPRNKAATNDQPRRFSADGRDFEYVNSNNHLLNYQDETAIQTVEDLDLLSDEEFFRFENVTIPFEQYQYIMQSNNSLPHQNSEETDSPVTTDGLKPEKTGQDLEKTLSREDCLLQLVPECNQDDNFHDPLGPASPTFY